MSMQGRLPRIAVLLGIVIAAAAGLATPARSGRDPRRRELHLPRPAAKLEPHRSPIALALSADGSRLLTANQTAGIGLAGRHRERQGPPRGCRPATGPPAWPSRADGKTRRRHALVRLRPRPAEDRGRPDRPSPAGSRSGPSRAGVVLSADGKTAYVAVGVANEVVRVDLEPLQGHRPGGRRPRAAGRRPLARWLAAPGRQCPVAGRLADLDRVAGASSGRSRSRATTSARWRSAPTARTATSPT